MREKRISIASVDIFFFMEGDDVSACLPQWVVTAILLLFRYV